MPNIEQPLPKNFCFGRMENSMVLVQIEPDLEMMTSCRWMKN